MALNKKIKDELHALKGLDSSSVYDEEEQKKKKAAQAKANASKARDALKSVAKAAPGTGLNSKSGNTVSSSRPTPRAQEKREEDNYLTRLRTELQGRLSDMRTNPGAIVDRYEDDESTRKRKELLIGSMLNSDKLLGVDTDGVYDARQTVQNIKGMSAQTAYNARRAEDWKAEAEDFGNTTLGSFYGSAKDTLDRLAGQLNAAATNIMSPVNRMKEAAKEEEYAGLLKYFTDRNWGTGARTATDDEIGTGSDENRRQIALLEEKKNNGTITKDEQFLLDTLMKVQQKYDSGNVTVYDNDLDETAAGRLAAQDAYLQTRANVDYMGRQARAEGQQMRAEAMVDSVLGKMADAGATAEDYMMERDALYDEYMNAGALKTFIGNRGRYKLLNYTPEQYAAYRWTEENEPEKLDALEEFLDVRANAQISKDAKEYWSDPNRNDGMNNIVGNTVLGLVGRLSGIMHTADLALQSIAVAGGVRNEIDYGRLNAASVGGEAAVAAQTQKLAEIGSLSDLFEGLDGTWLGDKNLGDLYRAGVDSAASIMNGALFGAGTGLATGTQVYSSAYTDAKERGATDGQAGLLATFQAAAEGLGEQVSFGSFQNLIVARGLDKKIGGKILLGLFQSAEEAGQEYVTEGMNVLADNLIMQELSEEEKSRQEFMAVGYDPTTAAEMAREESNERLLDAALGGFIGGALRSGSSYAGQGIDAGVTAIDDYATGSAIQKNNNAGAMAQLMSEVSGQEVSPETSKRKLGKQQREFLNKAGEYLAGADDAVRDIAYGKISNIAQAAQKPLEGTSQATKEKASKRTAAMRKSDEGASVGGESVTVQGFVKTAGKSGDARLNIKKADGTLAEANMEDVTFDSRTAEVYSYAADMATPELANMFRMSIQPDQMAGIERVANGYSQAYDMAKAGFKEASVRASSLTDALTDEQVSAAYKLGADARSAGQMQAITAARQRAEANMGKAWKGGKATFDSSVVVDALDDEQKNQIDMTSAITGAMGVNVVFYESKADEAGRYTRENGSYNRKTNTIYIDVNAGRNYKGDSMTKTALLRTLSHEVTHAIQRNSPEIYAELRDTVTDILGDTKGATIEDLIDRKLAQDSSLTTRDAAMDELVADACEKMLEDSDAAQRLAEAHPEAAKTFFQKVGELLNRIAEAIRAAFKGRHLSTEAQLVMKDVERYQKMVDLWAKGVMQTAEVSGREIAISDEQQEMIDNDQPVDGMTEIVNSLRHDEDFMEVAEKKNATFGYVSQAVLRQAKKDRATIRDFFRDPNNKELLKLPPDVMGNTFFADSSYGGSEESTSVCIRSMAAQDLMDAISKDLGRPLTVQDTLLISQEIAAMTDRPECYYCYVATDRRAYREYLGNYLKQRDDVLEKYRAGADREALYQEFLAGRDDTRPMKARFDMWLKAEDSGIEMITGKDLASLSELFAEIEELKGMPGSKAKTSRYNQLLDATKYAQSASWAKKMKGYAAYNNHILKWTQKRVDDLNKGYGLRMYSFSDYSPAFVLENMQMLTDAAVRGLNVLAYTKEADFAEIFAPTGANMNVSVFAYEQNGQIAEDGMMGAAWTKARELRDKYPNVGIVMVATNDNIMQWAMQQDWVDVVIPYHLVRTGQAVAKYFGYKNYTAVSGDKKTLEYKKGDPTSVSPVEHRNDIVAYVDALQRYGLSPRFADWMRGYDQYLAGELTPNQFREMNPYYMKLVNETRRSYADTLPVQPVFDMDAAEASIDTMIKQGGYYQPIGGSFEAQGEIAGEIAEKIRGNGELMYDDVQYSARVTDPNTLVFLDNQETVTTYKTMQVVNGKLYPPMAAVVAGSYEDASELGTWEQATEHPELIKLDKKGKPQFVLNKGQGKGNVPAAYNPYMHSSNLVLNDQFSSAYNRTNLVTVECEVPVSELTSGYRAQYAKDAVGWHSWHTGTVAGALRKATGMERQVLLSRWIKPVRIVPDAEVARMYKDLLDGTGVAVPDNVVPPGLLTELEKIGVPITESGKVNRNMETNSDIQKQTREEAISTRFVLANMLEADAVSGEEVAWLRGYKNQFAKLEQLLGAIDQNKKIIRELMFKKGRTEEESVELQKARERNKILQDKVASIDEGLLNLEKADVIRSLVAREEQKIRDKEAEKRREGIAKVRENQRNTAIRKNIQRRAKRLDRMLRQPSDKEHIPEGLRGAMLDMMEIFAGSEAAFGGAKVDRERLYRAQREYEAMRGDEDNADLASRYDEDTADRLRQLADLMKDRKISDFNNAELTQLSMVIEHFEHLVRDQNEAFADSRRKKTEGYAEQIWQQTMTMKGRKENAITGNALVKALKHLGHANVIPPYFYKHLGGAMGKLGNDLLKAEGRYGVNMNKAAKRLDEIRRKYEHDKWMAKKDDILKLETEIGDTLELTREQALGIWASAKRERLNTVQRAAHLRDGGVILEKPARKLGRKGQEINVTPTKISQRDIQQIDKWLTDQQKAYADEMVGYISRDMAALGNETSMELAGYKKFGEGYYYPYKTSSDFRRTELGKVEDALIKNMGFTKSVTRNAKTPVVITDFSATVADHVNAMIMYNAFAVAQDQMMRVYDFKLDDSNSVKNLLRNAFGDEIPAYIEQHMRDLYGGVSPDRDAGLINWTIGAHKKQAVLGSASVVVQQPTALIRAMSQINPKYFVGQRVEGGFNEAMDYAGTAVIKDIGGFDSGVGRGATDWLNGKPKDWQNHAIKSGLDTVSDWAGLGAEYADKLAWTAIWKAVKREQADKYKADINSQELKEIAGERFDEVVRLTQVYDSVMTRSQLMRNKNLFWKMATSFMSEPTVTWNMLYDAGIEAFKNKKTGAAIGITASVLVSVILTNLAKATVTAARDDDDEEATYLERYAKNAAEGLINDAVPLNYMPIVRDIYSKLQGYEVERADMGIINDMLAAGEVMLDEEKTPIAKVKSLVTLVSIMTGLPAKNIWRDVEAAFNTAGAVPQSEARPGWLENALRTGAIDATPIGKWFDLTDSKANNADRLYEAILDGDMAGAEELREHLKVYNNADDDKAVDSLLRNRIKEGYEGGEITKTKAVDMLTKHAGLKQYDAEKRVSQWSYVVETGTEYSDLKDAYLEGEITKAEAIRARAEYGGSDEDDAQATVAKWEYELDTGIAYDDMKDAYIAGDVTKAEAVNARVKYGGADKIDAEKTLQQWEYEKKSGIPYADMKDAFIAGELTEKQAVNARMQYGGAREAEALQTVAEWKYEKDTGRSWSDMKADYIAGRINAKDVTNAQVKYAGAFEKDVKAQILKWDYEKDTGIAYNDMKGAYIEGDITAKEAVAARIKYGGMETEDAELDVSKWDFEIDYGYDYDDMSDYYELGKISKNEAIAARVKYGKSEKDDAYFAVTGWQYEMDTGKEWEGKFTKVHDAVESRNASAMQTAIKEVYDNSAYTDGKKAASALTSNITSTYKPMYIKASATERAAMEEMLLDAYQYAYELAGERYYGDSYKLKQIRKWLEQ